jgi:hypothetical protein
MPLVVFVEFVLTVNAIFEQAVTVTTLVETPSEPSASKPDLS